MRDTLSIPGFSTPETIKSAAATIASIIAGNNLVWISGVAIVVGTLAVGKPVLAVGALLAFATGVGASEIDNTYTDANISENYNEMVLLSDNTLIDSALLS